MSIENPVDTIHCPVASFQNFHFGTWGKGVVIRVKIETLGQLQVYSWDLFRSAVIFKSDLFREPFGHVTSIGTESQNWDQNDDTAITITLCEKSKKADLSNLGLRRFPPTSIFEQTHLCPEFPTWRIPVISIARFSERWIPLKLHWWPCKCIIYIGRPAQKKAMWDF